MVFFYAWLQGDIFEVANGERENIVERLKNSVKGKRERQQRKNAIRVIAHAGYVRDGIRLSLW